MTSRAIWEETENEIRYRVRDPDKFEPDSFRRKKLEGVDGVSIIIDRLKKEFVPEGHGPRAMVLQAYRFARNTERNPDGWTMERAKEWIKKHEASAVTEAALRVETNMQALGRRTPRRGRGPPHPLGRQGGRGARHRVHGQQLPDAGMD